MREMREIEAPQGRYLHKIGTDVYLKRGYMLPGETEADYEDVESIPEPQQDNYGERVEMLIRRRYSLSDEIALLRQRDTKPDEYRTYYEYVEDCKKEAKTNNAEMEATDDTE